LKVFQSFQKSRFKEHLQTNLSKAQGKIGEGGRREEKAESGRKQGKGKTSDEKDKGEQGEGEGVR